MNCKFRCPNCNSTLSIQSEWAGKKVCCANCKHQVQLPPLEELSGNQALSASEVKIESPVSVRAYDVEPPQEILQSMSKATMFTALKKYAQFSGRASRREYWLFALLDLILNSIAFGVMFFAPTVGGILFWIVCIGMLMPKLAVAVRRCHDLDMPGWFTLINFTPFIGPLVFAIFCCLPSRKYTNRYGINPNGINPDKAWLAIVIFFLYIIGLISAIVLSAIFHNPAVNGCKESQSLYANMLLDYAAENDGNMPPGSVAFDMYMQLEASEEPYHEIFYIGEGLRMVRDNPDLPIAICFYEHSNKYITTTLSGDIKEFDAPDEPLDDCFSIVKYLLDKYFPDQDPYTRKLMLDNASAIDTPPDYFRTP